MIKTAKAIHKDILNTIKAAQSILITSHKNPDGDSIGSQLALARLLRIMGKDVFIINHDVIPARYTFLPDTEFIKNINDSQNNHHFDLAIVLECPDLKRTGDAVKKIGDDTELINIDHHPDNTDFGDIILIDTKAAAVGEILVELFLEWDQKIDSDMATQLYTAILTDTGRFRFESTTKRTMEIAGKLIEAGANSREICDNIYFSLSESILRLTGKVFSRLRVFENGKICMISIDRKLLRENDVSMADTEGMAEFTLYLNGTVVGALLREVDDNVTKVSLRSRDKIDVCRLAHKYDGGGHINASGCKIDLPIGLAEEKLLADLRELLND